MTLFKILMLIFTALYFFASIGASNKSTRMTSTVGYIASAILLLASCVLEVLYG